MKNDFRTKTIESPLERGVLQGRGVFILRQAQDDTIGGQQTADSRQQNNLRLAQDDWNREKGKGKREKGGNVLRQVQIDGFLYFILTFFILMTSSSFSATEPEADSLTVYKTPSVTVTADKALEGKSPVPFINFSQAEIQKTYIIRDVPELLSELPSIISYSESGNGIGYSYLTMRGFSQHRISVFVNGIPQNDPEEHNVFWIDMPDIASNADNIQIQRGAGIVNYGAASIGGSINLTTSNFVNQPGVKVYSGIGWQEYGAGEGTIQPTMSKYSLEVSSGIVGNYAVYGRLSRINTTGYRDNMWAELNSYFLSAVRFDDNFTTQINIYGGPISDGLGYTGLPKEYIKDLNLRRINPSYWEYSGPKEISFPYVPRRKQEIEEFSQPHYEILNDWFINENLIFRSSLFYYTGDGFFDYDGSWADGFLKDWFANDFQFPDSTMTTKNSLLRGTVSNKHGGWIPRLQWNHGNGELSVGAEMRIHRSEHYGQIKYSEFFPPAYDPDYKFYYNEGRRNIFSIFASEYYKLNDKLTINAETQLVRQTYELGAIKQGNEYIAFLQSDGTNISSQQKLFTINYLFLNPRLGVNYLIQDNMNAYAMIAYTKREPRMKNLYSADEAYYGALPQFEYKTIDDTAGYDFSKPLVKPESMLDIELGWNMKAEDFNIGINAYWMEYFDELVSTGIVDIWGRPVDGNVPRTRHAGVELQGAYILMKNSFGKLNLSANMTYSNNRIVEFDFITNALDTISLEGNPVGGFPDLMANIRLSYSNDDFYCSLLGKYIGGFRTDNYGDLISDQRIQTHLANDWDVYIDNKLDAYFVLNADFSYTFRDVLTLPSLKIQAKVNNLLNNLYAAYGIGKAFFPAAERNFIIGIEMGI
ncbi:MAG: TonB-dependent receptor [bacterium]